MRKGDPTMDELKARVRRVLRSKYGPMKGFRFRPPTDSRPYVARAGREVVDELLAQGMIAPDPEEADGYVWTSEARP